MLRCAITPGLARTKADADLLLAQIAGLPPVDVLLLREKQLAAGELLALSQAVAETLRRTNPQTKVLIARWLDVALAAGLDGVHLSAAPGELTPPQVRRLLPEAFISVSCHTLEEVGRARDAGASAILFAPVFGKVVGAEQVVAAQGLRGLRDACQAAGAVPVFALGSVTWADEEACQEAGAAGIAGIRLFFPTPA